MPSARPLWSPTRERMAASQMAGFMKTASTLTEKDISSYADLYAWSVSEIESFWDLIWQHSSIIHSKPYDEILSSHQMPGAKWFSGARLNFAENLLRHSGERPALISWNESGPVQTLSFSELRQKVASCAAGLKSIGVTRGDRVAAFVPNAIEPVIAMLATTSIGAIWSSCSPDFGLQAIQGRFGQIQPKVLIAADTCYYQGKEHDCLERVSRLVNLTKEIETTVIIQSMKDNSLPEIRSVIKWDDLQVNNPPPLTFEQLPFDHPVYIMYSSGTTGVPKCIVHGAGGTLLQHYKEHALHTNLGIGDSICYYTTTGWMMWNWLVSALQVGATVILYDGSPTYPDLHILWSIIEKEKITVFGTSPKFLSACQQVGLAPSNEHDLSSLKVILSTGSPLTAENFSWVYNAVKSDLQLSSISGGTDIISCFMLGNPLLPVYSEEIQCCGLAMKVETYDGNGSNNTGEVGELVCTAPFPSMPISFWNDKDGSLYRSAYFEYYPGIWRHGDFVRLTEHGGVIVYGRSDATLNPGGIRIGTAEIYTPLETITEIVDSIVIGQNWQKDVRIVLFVRLTENRILSGDLILEIKSTIRQRTTPRHVPAIILQVSDIPYTISGKKVEIAVTRIVHGQTVSNRDALANPECLKEYANFSELK